MDKLKKWIEHNLRRCKYLKKHWYPNLKFKFLKEFAPVLNEVCNHMVGIEGFIKLVYVHKIRQRYKNIYIIIICKHCFLLCVKIFTFKLVYRKTNQLSRAFLSTSKRINK